MDWAEVDCARTLGRREARHRESIMEKVTKAEQYNRKEIEMWFREGYARRLSAIDDYCQKSELGYEIASIPWIGHFAWDVKDSEWIIFTHTPWSGKRLSQGYFNSISSISLYSSQQVTFNPWRSSSFPSRATRSCQEPVR